MVAASQPRKPSVMAPGMPPMRLPTTMPAMRPIQITRGNPGNPGRTRVRPRFWFSSPVAAKLLDLRLQALGGHRGRGHGRGDLEADLRPEAAAEGLGHRLAIAAREEAAPEALQRD